MKKLLLMLTISAFVATTVVAQDQTPVKQDKVEWERKIKDELKLTPDQVLKFDALSKEYKDKFTTLESDATITKEAQKEKKMALKKEKEAKLNEFLTPEQQTKYKELMERKKAEAKPAEAKPAS
jgi:protein CpxP